MNVHRVRFSALIYGALALVALGIGVAREDWLVVSRKAAWLPGSRAQLLVLSVALGLVLAAAVVVSTRAMVRRFGWVRALHSDFRGLFGNVTNSEAAWLAVFSGISEELFFRGALQPYLGIAITSILFGLVHIGPGKRFWVWTLWAGAMGFVFGALAQLTGDIVGVMIAHVIINYENLSFISAHDPDAAKSNPYARLPEPRLLDKTPRTVSRS